MREVRKLVLSNLLNEEIPIMMDDVIKILKKQDLEAMHLKDVFDVLQLQHPASKILATPYGKHELTPELARLHKKRLRNASLINGHVKAFLNEDDIQMKNAAMLARRLSLKYLAYLGQVKRDIASSQLHLFFLNLDATGSIQAKDAFKALGLQHYIDELRKANKEYENVYNQRKRNKRENSRKDYPIIRRETLWILRMLFDNVNSNQKIYKDVDYSQLVYELNLVLAANSKRIKTRIATNKRKARKKAEAEKTEAEKEASNKDNKPKSTEKPTEDSELNAQSHKTLIEKGNEIQKTTPSSNKKGANDKGVSNMDLKSKLMRPRKGKSGRKGGKG